MGKLSRHPVMDRRALWLGVAFFSPFDQTRYFFPLRPVAVSPIGIREFFSQHGLVVMTSELTWIWLPAAALVVGLRALKQACVRTGQAVAEDRR